MTPEEWTAHRAQRVERAVLLALPIGRTLQPCGTPARVEFHRRRGETCGLCRMVGQRARVESLWKPLAAVEEARALRPIRRKATQRRYNSKAEVQVAKLEWQRQHPERKAAASRRYIERLRATDPARLVADRRNRKMVRRARLKQVDWTRIDRRTVWSRDGGVCHICTLPADLNNWHLDHVIPIARGGAHLYTNVRVSHPSCNQRKGARTA